MNAYALLLQVTSHLGPDQLPNALYNSHLVIIPAGVPRKPGMTRDDLFNINAGKYNQHVALLVFVVLFSFSFVLLVPQHLCCCLEHPGGCNLAEVNCKHHALLILQE